MTPDFEVIVQTRRNGGTPEQCAEAAGISVHSLRRYLGGIAERGSRVDVFRTRYADAFAQYQEQHSEIAVGTRGR
jgi:trans-aconitate methyltransferase